jgi:hypothetical protein
MKRPRRDYGAVLPPGLGLGVQGPGGPKTNKAPYRECDTGNSKAMKSGGRSDSAPPSVTRRTSPVMERLRLTPAG